MTDTQINEKGAQQYIRAARILTDAGGPVGPTIHCRGLAIEIALKLCMEHRGLGNPHTHDLEALYKKCGDVRLSDEDLNRLRLLNDEYIGSGDLKYPSRYRSSHMRGYTTPGQDLVESMLAAILSQQAPKANPT